MSVSSSAMDPSLRPLYPEFCSYELSLGRLAIVLLEDFRARSSPSTDEDQKCPRLLNEWLLDEHMKLGAKSASAQASTSSSTSTSQSSAPSARTEPHPRCSALPSESLDDVARSSSTSSTRTPAQFTPEQKAGLARGYLDKAKTFLEQKDYDKAMNSLDALIALNLKDEALMEDANYLRANLLDKRFDSRNNQTKVSQDKTKATSNAVSNKPAVGNIVDDNALYSAASEQYKKGRFAQAVEAYESLFKLQNSNLETHELVKAHFECGAAHHALNQLEEASYHYGIIIADNSADLKIKADALMNRAAIFTELKNLSAAIRDTEEAVKVLQEGKLDSDLVETLQEQIDTLKNRLRSASQSTTLTLTNRQEDGK